MNAGSVIAQLKKLYIWEDVGYALRFEGVVDISKKKMAVFVIPEKHWEYPRTENGLMDTAINFIEHHKNNSKPKFKRIVNGPSLPSRKEFNGLKTPLKMNYGIHQGKPLVQVPADYLIWCFENDRCSSAVKEYVKKNLSTLKMEAANAKKGIR